MKEENAYEQKKLLRELAKLEILDKWEEEVVEVGSKELQSSWEIIFIEI